MLVVSMKEYRCVIYVCVEKGASLLQSSINFQHIDHVGHLLSAFLHVTLHDLKKLYPYMLILTLSSHHSQTETVSIHVDLNTQ